MGGTASGRALDEGFLHPSPRENNRGFLTVLFLVSMAEQQRQEQPVEHEAAVAAAGCPRPQGADAACPGPTP
jgi:hypothetical protein